MSLLTKIRFLFSVSGKDMSGKFDLEQAYVSGSWESNIDAAFGASGDWGALKQEDKTIIR